MNLLFHNGTMMKWTKKKPKLTEECLLITAHYFGGMTGWNYHLYEIKKTDFEDKWYWGIFDDGDEWGDYADLKAELYYVLPILKSKKQIVNRRSL